MPSNLRAFRPTLLGLAGAAALSWPAGSADLDACAEFEVAVALHMGAFEAVRTHIGDRTSYPFDAEDTSPEARAWFRTKRALQAEFNRTHRRVARARAAAQATVRDPAALAVLDDVQKMTAASAPLDGSLLALHRKFAPSTSDPTRVFARLNGASVDHAVALARLRTQALKTACYVDGRTVR